MAITSMVLGIVGLACWFLLLPPLNFLASPVLALLGLVAIILGALALKKPGENRAMSVTGITTGSISILFFIGLIFIVIVAFLLAGIGIPFLSSLLTAFPFPY